MLKFVPDYCFNRFDEADAEFLLSIGVRGIILDVDNTLEPYENALPGEHVKAWISSLREAGISLSIVSNNNGERINLFNSELGLPVFYRAKKPFKKNLLRAMEKMGTSPEETVAMGDQIFTDVWAARNAGVRAILVPPINDRRDLLTRFKRLLERPILKKYRKQKEE
ncbi:MAG: YqeG family HAD IIIA-type phosphatase [Clostridia bacterium]|nr:YqeG family HAD IIIA-type phosphatase [Clostridia bacterium]